MVSIQSLEELKDFHSERLANELLYDLQQEYNTYKVTDNEQFMLSFLNYASKIKSVAHSYNRYYETLYSTGTGIEDKDFTLDEAYNRLLQWIEIEKFLNELGDIDTELQAVKSIIKDKQEQAKKEEEERKKNNLVMPKVTTDLSLAPKNDNLHEEIPKKDIDHTDLTKDRGLQTGTTLLGNNNEKDKVTAPITETNTMSPKEEKPFYDETLPIPEDTKTTTETTKTNETNKTLVNNLTTTNGSATTGDAKTKEPNNKKTNWLWWLLAGVGAYLLLKNDKKDTKKVAV